MHLKNKAKDLIAKGASGVLFYRLEDGFAIPHLFTSEDIEKMPRISEISSLERYPIAGIVRRILEESDDKRYGVVVRGCDERAIIELSKQGQVELGRLELIGIACSEDLSLLCRCSKPYPDAPFEGPAAQEVMVDERLEKVEKLEEGKRLSYWLSNFALCMKCMGCRNICPLCFCKECSLEDNDLIRRGLLPPDIPAFHLVRAVDMAGRCVMCGLCEEVCPAKIPLRILYRKVAIAIEEIFGYVPGRDASEKNPLSIIGTIDEE